MDATTPAAGHATPTRQRQTGADPERSAKAKAAWETRRANKAKAAGSGVRDSFGNEAPTTRRPVNRAPMRPADGQVRGRSGEILTRGRTSGSGYFSEFDIPEHLRDPNWDLIWGRQSVHGKPDPANINMLHDNGWRPASRENYKSVMPDLQQGGIIERDGLILMERPMALSHEALDEARRDALELREVQTEAFGGRKLPKGFDKGYYARNRDGTAMDGRKNIKRGEFERAPKELRPAYEYATDDTD
jgi:hypothetical protein